MNVATYLRCSTDTQDQSIGTQESIITRECKAKGHNLITHYREPGVSAGIALEKRPIGAQLLKDVVSKNRPFDAIMVVRLDRMFRNPVDEMSVLAYLQKHNCPLISISDPIDNSSPTGELLHGIMMHVRAFERRQTGLRIYEHHLSAFLQGKWPGCPVSMGFAWNKEKAVFEANGRAEDVVRVFEAYVFNNGNATRTVKYLNAIGIPSANNSLWSSPVILKMLRSKIYRQRLSYDGREIDARKTVPRIVSEELIAQVDNLLTIGARLGFNTECNFGKKRCYSGLLRCSMCGELMTSNGHDKPAEKAYSSWLCRGRRAFGVCDSKQLSTLYIDALVGRAVGLLFDGLRKEIKQGIKNTIPTKTPKPRQTSREKLTAERARVVDLYAKGYIQEPEFISRASSIDAKLKGMTEDSGTKQQSAILPRELIKAMDGISEDWRYIPDDEKRGLLLQIGAVITVNTSGELPFWIELQTDLLPEAIITRGIPRSRWPMKFLK